MEGGKRRFPPSLNAVKSEYKIFCEQHGGPIICDDRFAKINFEHCCREFPRRRFEPIIRRRWVTDPVHGIRHWPAMAFAGSVTQRSIIGASLRRGNSRQQCSKLIFAKLSSQLIGPPFCSQKILYSLLTALRLGGKRRLPPSIACASQSTASYTRKPGGASRLDGWPS